MNMRVSMLAVAAVAAIVFAAPAQAITVELDFTADFAAGAPQTTVTGRFVYEAPSLTSEITSLTSVDLTISGHTYTLGDLSFAGSLFPGKQIIGTTDPGLGMAVFGQDTFFLNFTLADGASGTFSYGTSSPEGLATSTSFSQFRLTAVPEPATWSLLLTGFVAAGSLAARRRLGRASI